MFFKFKTGQSNNITYNAKNRKLKVEHFVKVEQKQLKLVCRSDFSQLSSEE